jgi:hypothetical protein
MYWATLSLDAQAKHTAEISKTLMVMQKVRIMAAPHEKGLRRPAVPLVIMS